MTGELGAQLITLMAALMLVVQLLLVVPGVVTGPGASGLNQNDGYAVNGARAVMNNYLLDGGDNNDPQEGVDSIDTTAGREICWGNFRGE